LGIVINQQIRQLKNHKEANMANQALFLGWNRPARGREEQAMKLWGKTMEYYGKLQAEGRIESFEPVLLTAHGGDLNGFFLIRGDADKLSEVRREDEFVDFIIEAGYCLDGFGVVSGYVGEALNDAFTRWSKLVTG
jgi:hypothetical protein